MVILAIAVSGCTDTQDDTGEAEAAETSTTTEKVKIGVQYFANFE